MDNKLNLAHPTLLTLQHIMHLGNGKGNPGLLHKIQLNTLTLNFTGIS